MEYLSHWATMCKCSLCGEIPETAPLYHCPFQHQYCSTCYKELKKVYRGNIPGGSTCKICKANAKFELSKINNDFLKKLKTKPGIGRPFRYDGNSSTRIESPLKNKGGKPAFVTVEHLFQLPENEIHKLLNGHSKESTKIDTDLSFFDADKDIVRKATTSSMHSKKPIKCPHMPCRKMVALSSFFSHFKYEHADIPKYYSERGKELLVPVDVSLIEYGTQACIGVINLYEINRIDFSKSRSSQSVIKTCHKFSQKTPVNTFWLMVSGSDTRNCCSYAFYWLFVNSEESYRCTIELSSERDSQSVCTFCGVISTFSNDTFEDVPKALNCLLVTRQALEGMLTEGMDLKLRVTVH